MNRWKSMVNIDEVNTEADKIQKVSKCIPNRKWRWKNYRTSKLTAFIEIRCINYNTKWGKWFAHGWGRCECRWSSNRQQCTKHHLQVRYIWSSCSRGSFFPEFRRNKEKKTLHVNCAICIVYVLLSVRSWAVCEMAASCSLCTVELCMDSSTMHNVLYRLYFILFLYWKFDSIGIDDRRSRL